jgi:hypothetical protein
VIMDCLLLKSFYLKNNVLVRLGRVWCSRVESGLVRSVGAWFGAVRRGHNHIYQVRCGMVWLGMLRYGSVR